MFDLTQISRKTQQFVCMALSAAIVALGLSLAAFTAETTSENARNFGYVITIEMLS